MNIRDPREYDRFRRRSRQRRRVRRLQRRVVLWGIVLLVGCSSLLTMQYARALPGVQPTTFAVAHAPQYVPIAWPAGGQAAVSWAGQSTTLTNGAQKPVPTASVAKLILGLALLRQKPLQLGEQGPTITMTAADVALYDKYIAEGGATLPISVGDELSEYEALQAVMLASSNNISDTLVRWGFGSQAEYRKAAQQMAQGLGMTDTRIGSDGSGFAPDTVSTARDLTRLGQAALQNATLKKIVGQKTAYVPLFGRLTNHNTLLGGDIIGIKTGSTDEAGGCYMFAAEHMFADGQKRTFVGTMLGTQSLDQAMASTPPLLDSIYRGFGPISLAHRGQVVARYKLPWGGQAQALAAQDLAIFGWLGAGHSARFDSLALSAPANKNTVIGKLVLEHTSVPVVLGSDVLAPPSAWRLWRR